MVHAHAADADRAPGRGDTEEGAHLSASQRPPRNDRISLGNDLFDLEVDVRECVPPLAPLLLEPLTTHAEIRVIAARVLGDEAVDRLHMSLVPDLVEKLADECLVSFGRHGHSPGSESGVE